MNINTAIREKLLAVATETVNKDNGYSEERKIAWIAVIGKLRSYTSIDELESIAFGETRDKVALAALEALTKLPDASIYYRKVLSSDDFTTKKLAVAALVCASLKLLDTTDRIVELLLSPKRRVNGHSFAYALKALDWVPATDAEIFHFHYFLSWDKQVVDLGERAVPFLADFLFHDSFVDRKSLNRKALDLLEEIGGSSTLEILLDAYQDTDFHDKQKVLEAIQKIVADAEFEIEVQNA